MTGDAPRVGHRKQAGHLVLQLKVLVFKLVAVDRLAARAVVVRKIAAIADHST